MGLKNRLSTRLGNLAGYYHFRATLILRTNTGYLRLIAVSESVFRVTASETDDFDDFSYAVPEELENHRAKFEIGPSEIRVSTSLITAIITLDPVSIAFYSANGILLNEDEPSFGTSFLGQETTAYKKLQPFERFIGLGEKTGNLNRWGQGYTNWNTDAFGYATHADPIYMSIPFYMGLLVTQQAYGIFLDNTYKSHFNFGASNNRFSSFTVEDGDLNYYFIHHTSVAKIIESYTGLTGRMPLPPKWSLGLQQCRYSYYPNNEVLTLARTYREKQIPADVIYLDIHYMDRYKVFTWSPENFPNPELMLGTLKEMGFNTVIIVDPGVKVEAGYEPYDDGLEKNVFLNYPDGKPYEGAVWPGWCHFPDFTKLETREWWGQKFKPNIEAGVTGFWNDMNEPATWGQQFPDLVEFDYEGQQASHKKGHNVYGYQMARATFEGTAKLLDGKRPFVLTRAGYSGVQRYAAVWTGDNTASDDHLLLGVRLVNSLGLSGVAFAGVDIGGFDGEASKELFARWMTVGAFTPMFRIHSMIDSRDSEPWAYGEGTEAICRNYVRLRYALMPYIYSAFYEAAETGLPVARSLAIDFTWDGRVYEHHFQNQYMFGPNILVAPVISTQLFAKVLLPGHSGWYDFFNDKYYTGDEAILTEAPLDKLPLFVKAGAIILKHDPGLHTADIQSDKLYIHLYSGHTGTTVVWYEDDGLTNRQNEGFFYKRSLQHLPSEKLLILSEVEGYFSSCYNELVLVFHGYPKLESVWVNNAFAGNPHTHQFSLMPAIPKFDPLGHAGSTIMQHCQALHINNSAERLRIAWQYQ